MTSSFCARTIPNPITAKRIHADLRANGASHYMLGCFYRAMLARRFWQSQKSMSEFFEISTSGLSRLIALSRIPEPVVKAIGGPERITFRVGELLLDALQKLGEAEVSKRARDASRLGCESTDDVLELIVANRKPTRQLTKVRVRLSRDRQTLRVEIPQLHRLLPRLSELEKFLSTAFLMFDAIHESDAAAARGDSRNGAPGV